MTSENSNAHRAILIALTLASGVAGVGGAFLLILPGSWIQHQHEFAGAGYGPESTWPLMPTFPMRCLRSEECELGADQSDFEIDPAGVEDWNFYYAGPNSSNNMKVVSLIGQRNVQLNFSEISAELEEVLARAVVLARDLQDPKSKSSRSITEEIGKEPPQLPPRPDRYVVEVETYRASQVFLKCEAASTAIDLARELHSSNGEKLDKLLAAIYMRYVESCFSQAPSDWRNRLALFWTTWPPDRSMGVYCLGYALDEKYVITAKHCVVDPNELHLAKRNPANATIELRKVPSSLISFANSLGEVYSYKISKIHADVGDKYFNPFNRDDDIAIVELETARILTASPSRGAALEDWNRVVSFTSFVSIEHIQNCLNHSGDIGCDGSNLIRMDEAPTCVVPTRRASCLLHSCQTRPGSSGSPILAFRGNAQPEIVGVHNGSISNPLDAPCGLPRGDWYRNYGLATDSSKAFQQWLKITETTLEKM